MSNDVHVWRLPLIAAQLVVQSYADLLSDDEQQRARRFKADVDRQRFILTRGALRILLGRYLGMQPTQIKFAYGAYGKPQLDGPDSNGLQFNVSHSHQWALVAVVRDRPIGVDVECYRTIVDLDALAARFLTPNEYRAIASLPIAEKQAAFFCGWSRKEAVLKAIGRGLADLSRVEVTMLPDEAARVIRQDNGFQSYDCEHRLNGAIANWWLSDLCIEPGYMSAVAAIWSASMSPLLKLFNMVLT
jgi:4'-phosphopantetheinyl transferase